MKHEVVVDKAIYPPWVNQIHVEIRCSACWRRFYNFVATHGHVISRIYLDHKREAEAADNCIGAPPSVMPFRWAIEEHYSKKHREKRKLRRRNPLFTKRNWQEKYKPGGGV